MDDPGRLRQLLDWCEQSIERNERVLQPEAPLLKVLRSYQAELAAKLDEAEADDIVIPPRR